MKKKMLSSMRRLSRFSLPLLFLLSSALKSDAFDGPLVSLLLHLKVLNSVYTSGMLINRADAGKTLIPFSIFMKMHQLSR